MVTAEMAPETYQFDVAVSFAGEDRELVDAIVGQLKVAGVRVFYDADHQADMWGEDLIEFFDDVYRVKARYAVIFVSHYYAEKMWTRHERRSALARGLEQRSAYVLPIRLDDTELRGLRPTVGYLDARHVGIDGIISTLLTKLQNTLHVPASPITRVPRTEVERQQLLTVRPGAWEYLYFVAQLLHERDLLESRYLDHEMRYAALSGSSVGRDDVVDYMMRAADEVSMLVDSLGRLSEPEVQDRAFGALGNPSDPERILHLAKRWNAIYEGFLAWAARLRGVTTSADFRKALELLARYVDEPVDAYRGFVDKMVAELDLVPAALAANQPVVLDMVLELRIGPDAISAFSAELKQVQKALQK